MNSLTYAKVRTMILFVVGLALVAYNAILGDHNFPTFIVALMFCGFPFVINLDEIIRKSPISMTVPVPDVEPVKKVAP